MVRIGDLPRVGSFIDVPMPARGRMIRRSLRWLHSASVLMQQGQRQNKPGRYFNGVESRRWKQRQAMGRVLLDQSIVGWVQNKPSGQRFWIILRWAGAGFSLAWWLAKG